MAATARIRFDRILGSAAAEVTAIRLARRGGAACQTDARLVAAFDASLLHGRIHYGGHGMLDPLLAISTLAICADGSEGGLMSASL